MDIGWADPGFGFSAMEIETLAHYDFPVVVIVFDNGGVYGGDRRTPEEIAGPYKSSYHILMEAFVVKGCRVETPTVLKSALDESFGAPKPAVFNVIIDLCAGSTNGRLQQKNECRIDLAVKINFVFVIVCDGMECYFYVMISMI